jgi:hypothetical protein
MKAVSRDNRHLNGYFIPATNKLTQVIAAGNLAANCSSYGHMEPGKERMDKQ